MSISCCYAIYVPGAGLVFENDYFLRKRNTWFPKIGAVVAAEMRAGTVAGPVATGWGFYPGGFLVSITKRIF